MNKNENYPDKFEVGQIWYSEDPNLGECVFRIANITQVNISNFNYCEVEITVGAKYYNKSDIIKFFATAETVINKHVINKKLFPLMWNQNGKQEFCNNANIWQKSIRLDKELMPIYSFIYPILSQKPYFIEITPAYPVKYFYQKLNLDDKVEISRLNCKKCHTYYDMSEPNQNDGTLICWACRNGF